MKNRPSEKFRFPLFCFILFQTLLFTISFNLQAQESMERNVTLPAENPADSLQVVQEIATSREIHKKQHAEALEYQHAEKAVEIALSMGDSLLYARALDNLGLLYRYHQHYEEAIDLHTKAFKLIESTPAAPPLAKMIYANNAGVACRYAGKYKQAVEYYLKALAIAEREEDLKNIAISSNGLGNTLLHLPNREEDALQYFERSLEAEKKRDNSLGMAMNYLSISDFFIQKRDFGTAREYLDRLLKINQEREDIFGIAITYEFFGLSYLEEEKELEKARNYFQKSLALFRKLENTHKQADVLVHLGKLSRLQGRDGMAAAYFRQSWDLAKEINSQGLLMENARRLSALYEKQNNLPEALKFYKIFQQYKDSVNLIEQETQIAALEKRYAFEKKENQIALLKKDQMLQQARLQSQEETLGNQRLFLLLLLIGLLAFVGFAMLQYRNIKAKRRTNLLLQGQNQEILKQRDEITLQKEKIEKVNRQLEETMEELVQQQKKNEERKIKLLESKFENKIQSLALQSLESQMNPHFLFNGMNAVRWLVIQNKNDQAREYLDTFANLLRLSLTNNRKTVISLSEELRTTSLYLEIEKLRFGSEFTFSIHIDPGISADQIMLPPKILQPLAENAVKHGLLPSRKTEKKLEIRVTEKEEAICVEVLDNGTGFRMSPHKENESRPDGTHLGLKLLQERLTIYNQQNENSITFQIGSHQDEQEQLNGTRAAIVISRQKITEPAAL